MLYLLNPMQRRVEKVQVDDCVITEGPRCDWLILTNDEVLKEEIYVELKGTDVYRGVEQLEVTINTLSSDRARQRKRCFIVFSRNPMTLTDSQRYKVRFQKNFNAEFNLVRNKTEAVL